MVLSKDLSMFFSERTKYGLPERSKYVLPDTYLFRVQTRFGLGRQVYGRRGGENRFFKKLGRTLRSLHLVLPQTAESQKGKGGGGKASIPFHKEDGHTKKKADEADEKREEGRV